MIGLLAGLIVAWASAASADVRYMPPEPRRVGIIEIFGSIEPADGDRFADVLELAKTSAKSFYVDGVPLIMVSLNSAGGDVATAMKIGRLVRASFANTSVMTGGRCASACVFILASGAFRVVSADGRVGLHRPVFAGPEFGKLPPAQARDRYNRMLREIRSFLAGMGAPDQLYLAMTRVPSQEIRWLTRREVAEFDLDGEDPAIAEWIRAAQRNEMGEEMQRKFDEHSRCLQEGRAEQQCSRLLD